MGTKISENEYPEHLNPFHKKRSGLRQSFRGLKRTLLRSIRGKEKEPAPEIRTHKSTDTLPQIRHTVSTIPRFEASEPIALPRSRFNERLTRHTTLSVPPTRRQLEVSDTTGKNPFDEEVQKPEVNKNHETDTVSIDLPPRPAERKKKRRKNQAPIPPNGAIGMTPYLSVPNGINNSQWSLTSTETDISSAYYSENEMEYTVTDTSKNEEILQITREIEKFTDDSNNNFIVATDEIEAKKEERTSEDAILTSHNESAVENSKTCENETVVTSDTEKVDDAPDSELANMSLNVQESNLVDECNSETNTEQEKDVLTTEDEASKLEKSNDSNSVKENIEFFEGISTSTNESPSPTLKVRKSILTKEALLGSENT